MSIDKSSDYFDGFFKAERLMNEYQSRARIHERIATTRYLEARDVAGIHVQNTARTNEIVLTAFDALGSLIDTDTLYVYGASQRMDVTPEFDHDFTNMPIPASSDLERAIAAEDGWVVNMAALRAYDPLADRRATQRAVMLAHLGDMIASGQVRGFEFPSLGGDEKAA